MITVIAIMIAVAVIGLAVLMAIMQWLQERDLKRTALIALSNRGSARTRDLADQVRTISGCDASGPIYRAIDKLIDAGWAKEEEPLVKDAEVYPNPLLAVTAEGRREAERLIEGEW